MSNTASSYKVATNNINTTENLDMTELKRPNTTTKEVKQKEKEHFTGILKGELNIDLMHTICNTPECSNPFTCWKCNICKTMYCNGCYISKKTCPKENHMMTETQPVLKQIENNVRRNLFVKCMYPNCQEQTKLDEMENHMRSCKEHHKKCIACNQLVPGYELQNHKSNSCPQRLTTCNGCNKEMTFKALNQHVLVCDKVIVQCVCKQSMKRQDLHKHQWTDCTDTFLTCDICKFEGKLVDLKTHLSIQKYADLHIEHVVAKNKEKSNDNEPQKSNSTNLKIAQQKQGENCHVS
jgi:hypothetical protein